MADEADEKPGDRLRRLIESRRQMSGLGQGAGLGQGGVGQGQGRGGGAGRQQFKRIRAGGAGGGAQGDDGLSKFIDVAAMQPDERAKYRQRLEMRKFWLERMLSGTLKKLQDIDVFEQSQGNKTGPGGKPESGKSPGDSGTS